ncbi:sulfate adenylyltransferase [Saccharopolyspora antimicrobica]|uniref:adenylyl-sulfate kinase n=1 Tax=Saccharopolyspora antimicrobica TaxID=455193 RepID=A0A1I5GN25_9PSEU|nr:adenylyl-sulfate kinase [Saccharopolyspora antimicrobica]RKT87444.1 sulfate adenylyltransferase [Saccharopolyspora antimicrobica]SFO37464.1 sulfate adenylyltransferase [Saccharopolyspora antimicrobica]
MSANGTEPGGPGGATPVPAGSRRRVVRHLEPAELADVELLLDGAFPPLRGFLTAAEAFSVRNRQCLRGGAPWPDPLTLPVADEAVAADEIELRDGEGAPVAVVRNEAPWHDETGAHAAGPVQAAGEPTGVLRRMRPPAAEVRAKLPAGPVLGLLPEEPLHHRELAQIRVLAAELDAHVLVLPRMRGPRPELLVQALLAAEPELPEGTTIVPVPLVRRTDPKRDALLSAHVAAAYGVTHLISEQPLEQAPIEVVAPPEVVRDRDGRWRPAAQVPPADRRPGLSAERLRELLDRGEALPGWFTTAAIAEQQRRIHPPLAARGFTVLFTGLSGAGKSTLARALRDELNRHDHRAVTLLDGDVVRRTLCEGLGFSAADRSRNVRRIGFVAAEVTRHGGAAICAPIAPYHADRDAVRRMVAEVGGFVLVHVATPLGECERRDRKGLYRKARAGSLPEFTGVSAPYEVPGDADLVLDTTGLSPEEAVGRVVALLRERGWVGPWTGA